MAKTIVGIGGLAAARGGGVLVTYALGSCVGICLYEKDLKLGAMAHAFLPDSGIARGSWDMPDEGGRYVDTAVINLLATMESCGAAKRNITARLYGGARMYAIGSGSPLVSSACDIGRCNCEAARRALAALDIPIAEEDIGGTAARTIEFRTDDGSVSVNKSRRG